MNRKKAFLITELSNETSPATKDIHILPQISVPNH